VTIQLPRPTRSNESERFQIRLYDSFLVVALLAVSLGETINIFQSLPTHLDPRERVGSNPFAGDTLLGPEARQAQRRTPVDVRASRYSNFWLRRLGLAVGIGWIAVLLSFCVAKRAVNGGTQRIRNSVPRMTASLVCALVLASVAGLTYSWSSESYIEVFGRQFNQTVFAGIRAVGIGLAISAAVAFIEWSKRCQKCFGGRQGDKSN